MLVFLLKTHKTLLDFQIKNTNLRTATDFNTHRIINVPCLVGRKGSFFSPFLRAHSYELRICSFYILLFSASYERSSPEAEFPSVGHRPIIFYPRRIGREDLYGYIQSLFFSPSFCFSYKGIIFRPVDSIYSYLYSRSYFSCVMPAKVFVRQPGLSFSLSLSFSILSFLTRRISFYYALYIFLTEFHSWTRIMLSFN